MRTSREGGPRLGTGHLTARPGADTWGLWKRARSQHDAQTAAPNQHLSTTFILPKRNGASRCGFNFPGGVFLRGAQAPAPARARAAPPAEVTPRLLRPPTPCAPRCCVGRPAGEGRGGRKRHEPHLMDSHCSAPGLLIHLAFKLFINSFAQRQQRREGTPGPRNEALGQRVLRANVLRPPGTRCGAWLVGESHEQTICVGFTGQARGAAFPSGAGDGADTVTRRPRIPLSPEAFIQEGTTQQGAEACGWHGPRCGRSWRPGC